jgi:uncharacterized protein
MRAIVALALLFAAMSAAAADSFVTTKGEATVEVRPDFARIQIELLAVGPDLDKIKADVDDRTVRVLSAAAKLAVAGADIDSTGVQVEREYESDRNGNDTLRGYRVSRDITVKLRAIDRYEEFAQALVDSGVDEVADVQGGVDDRTALKQRALVAASANAKSKARAIADELGIALGAPIEVGEEKLWFNQSLVQRTNDAYGEIVVTASRQRAAAGAVSGTPVTLVFRPSNFKVDAVVWVRFRIEPAKP